VLGLVGRLVWFGWAGFTGWDGKDPVLERGAEVGLDTPFENELVLTGFREGNEWVLVGAAAGLEEYREEEKGWVEGC
jgi:hypothetical protein